jgi:hypothetical protein
MKSKTPACAMPHKDVVKKAMQDGKHVQVVGENHEFGGVRLHNGVFLVPYHPRI